MASVLDFYAYWKNTLACAFWWILEESLLGHVQQGGAWENINRHLHKSPNLQWNTYLQTLKYIEKPKSHFKCLSPPILITLPQAFAISLLNCSCSHHTLLLCRVGETEFFKGLISQLYQVLFRDHSRRNSHSAAVLEFSSGLSLILQNRRLVFSFAQAFHAFSSDKSCSIAHRTEESSRSQLGLNKLNPITIR